ncbi:unnamed protein product [Closterium sp. Naga37s-1]|nr:unnamed protein product [Closterium sp. Naga37s-1]
MKISQLLQVITVALLVIALLPEYGAASVDDIGLNADFERFAPNGCLQNQTLCGSLCTFLKSDPNHCGSCNRYCATDFMCCSATCTSLLTDKKNCGKCGRFCRGTCIAGTCDYGAAGTPLKK